MILTRLVIVQDETGVSKECNFVSAREDNH